MPLSTFFTDQFDRLKDFMVAPDETVRCVRIDGEMKPMFFKALAKMEESADFSHVIFPYSRPFSEPIEYFDGLLELISQNFESSEAALAEFNVLSLIHISEPTRPTT